MYIVQQCVWTYYVFELKCLSGVESKSLRRSWTYVHKGSSLTFALLHAREEDRRSLQDILQYSPFKTESELLCEMDIITTPLFGTTGTRIIIWNLSRLEARTYTHALFTYGYCLNFSSLFFNRTSTGKLEFDFETDRYDIRITQEDSDTLEDAEAASYVPESLFKLRVWSCCMLPLWDIFNKSEKNQSIFLFLITWRNIAASFIWSPRCRSSFVVKKFKLSSLLRVWP